MGSSADAGSRPLATISLCVGTVGIALRCCGGCEEGEEEEEAGVYSSACCLSSWR